MNDMATLFLAGLAGLLLGAFFFGGLRWTLGKGLTSSHPALWLFSSLMLRMGLTLAGFYVVGGGQWQRFAACGLGFVIARFVVMRFAGALNPSTADGGRHAPHT